MKLALSLAALAGAIFLVLDMIWLLLVARGFYVAELGPLMKANPNLGAAAAFYLIYLAGLTIFVLLPAASQDSTSHALVYGAIFGLVAYATYDLTNLATLNGFSIRLALVDMAWGTVVTALSATGALLAAKAIGLIRL